MSAARVKGENILEEANRLTSRDRADNYGHAYDDASRFATIASVLTGLDIRPEHWALIQIAVKLSREANKHTRDNLVDIAGYARCQEKVLDRMYELDDIADAQQAIRDSGDIDRLVGFTE